MWILIETVNKVHRQLTFFQQLQIVKFYPLLFVYSYSFYFIFLYFYPMQIPDETKRKNFFMADGTEK